MDVVAAYQDDWRLVSHTFTILNSSAAITLFERPPTG